MIRLLRIDRPAEAGGVLDPSKSAGLQNFAGGKIGAETMQQAMGLNLPGTSTGGKKKKGKKNKDGDETEGEPQEALWHKTIQILCQLR